MTALRSWGRLFPPHHGPVARPASRFDPIGASDLPRLAFGRGRSYGDVCHNTGGALIATDGLDHFISFDAASGIVEAEAGVTLRDILALSVPQGWFLSATPGTREVTLGGAIANDVHGKNHHVAGSFGHHVETFELERSNGERLTCSPNENPALFAATIGGLGLTGFIRRARIRLTQVRNDWMVVETTRFSGLDEFWQLNALAEHSWPYTVAWIDCLSSGKALGRGVLYAGRHASARADLPVYHKRARAIPVDPPVSLVNGLSLRGFNALYYRAAKAGLGLQHYVPYFYPLDAIADWNRIYGQRGFYQYQCVLPPAAQRVGIAELLRAIQASGQGSFLAVLKTFGAQPSLGMLSFPRPGATLALDFPNRGEATAALFARLDAIVTEAGGALYPAKDARMPSSLFQSGYPLWQDFARHIDPGFSSDFWRRVST